MKKMKKKIWFIMLLTIFIMFSCNEKDIDKNIESLNNSYEEILKEFQEEVQNGIDYKNPYYFLVQEISTIIDSAIISVENSGSIDLDNKSISELLERVRLYSSNVQLTNQIRKLSIKRRQNTLKSKIQFYEVRNSLSMELLRKATRKDSLLASVPLLTAIDNNIESHLLMEAFLDIPDPKNSNIVILSPDSIRYISLDENFLYFKGKIRSFKDSITIAVSIVDSIGNSSEYILKQHYKCH